MITSSERAFARAQLELGCALRELEPVASSTFGIDSNATVQCLAARATRLLEVTAALSEVRTVDEVASVVLDKGLSIVEATRGFLARTDDSRMVMIAARGYTPEVHARVMTVTESSPIPLAEAVRTGQAVWLESIDEYRHRYGWAFGQFGAVSDTQAHVSVPLTYAGERVGGLGISFSTSTAFGAADRAFTLLLGQAAAAALHRARTYDEEREGRKRAELIAKAREDVLSIVAHDLRNPLNLIGMSAQTLLEVELPVERRNKLLATTQRAVNQMNRLIGDLLDAVRLQANHLSLQVADVAVRSLIHRVEELYGPLAEERRVRFATVAPSEPVYVRADEDRTLQALGNLLGNALKFTPASGLVSVCVTPTEGEVVFDIRDTGPGIPPEEIGHVFDRFWQARKTDKRGIGLGLAIVKGIVEAHGGRLWVESTPGVGSTFSVALPRARGSVLPVQLLPDAGAPHAR